MSSVKIELIDKKNGFKDIKLDEEYMGTLEDSDDLLFDVLDKIFKRLDVNTEVIQKGFESLIKSK